MAKKKLPTDDMLLYFDALVNRHKPKAILHVLHRMHGSYLRESYKENTFPDNFTDETVLLEDLFTVFDCPRQSR